MINYYKVLQINTNADTKEIKQAYRTLIRIHTPEKSPEEFKDLRKAYEHLINPSLRILHDAQVMSDILYDNFVREGDIHFSYGENISAISKYKEALKLRPEMNFLNFKLGTIYIKLNEPERAISEFKKFLKDNPVDIETLENLADSYRLMGEVNLAEKYYFRAYKLEPRNKRIKEKLLVMVQYYIYEKKHLKVIDFLKTCIKHNMNDDFFNIEYYLLLIETYIALNNMDNTSEILNQILQIIPNDQKSQRYVAEKLTNLAKRLFDQEFYTISELAITNASMICQDNDIMAKYKEIKEYNEYQLLVDKFLKDPNIASALKGPMYIYLYPKDISTKEQISKYEKSILKEIASNPERVIFTVNYIRDNYYLLYNYIPDNYDDIYEKALRRQNKKGIFNFFKF